MKQILHIVAKDVRHFWPEISVSLAILAALVCVYPLQWTGPIPVHDRREFINHFMNLQTLSRTFCILVPVSWCLLIARVFHAEGLVGDRQFWLTRPYERKNLLAAKFLFLAAFLYLPLVIAQCLLLVAAGLNPFSYIPAMLYNLFLISGILVLPLVAIAVVTSKFVSTALTLLGILICGLVVGALQMRFGSLAVGALQLRWAASGSDFKLPFGPHLPLALFLFSVCGVVIVLQYATRNALVSRLILLGNPVVIVIIGIAAPHLALSVQDRINRDYPPPAAGAPALVQLSDGRDDGRPVRVSPRYLPFSNVVSRATQISIPLHLSPVPEGSAVVANDLQITITNAEGFSWSDEGQTLNPIEILPSGDNRSDRWPVDKRWTTFNLSRSVFDNFQSGPLTVHFTLAITELRKATTTSVPMPAQDVAVPDLGVCGRRVMDSAWLKCRYAFREPYLTYATADWSETPCSTPQAEEQQVSGNLLAGWFYSEPPVRGNPWAGWVYREPAEFSIAPIVFSGLDLIPDHNNANGGKYLCTGSLITFTQYKPVRRTQTSLTLQDFHLPAQP